MSPDLSAIEHGGDLRAARMLFPGAPEPFIDLSTGINPHPYPIPQLPPDAFTRLPQVDALDALAAAAAEAYGAPSASHVVPAPGAQSLLAHVAALVQPGRAAVLGPTYREHVRAAALAGHRAEEVSDLARVRAASMAVVVNPNNPDGRILTREMLLDCAHSLQGDGGILVVDEAFMEVGPRSESLAGDVRERNIVVLRSFGKFFGLAGIRLGFALAAPQLARQLRDRLGPWAVSGPALTIGAAALGPRWRGHGSLKRPRGSTPFWAPPAWRRSAAHRCFASRAARQRHAFSISSGVPASWCAGLPASRLGFASACPRMNRSGSGSVSHSKDLPAIQAAWVNDSGSRRNAARSRIWPRWGNCGNNEASGERRAAFLAPR
jgi:histidinol-phosphate/aromatic aminotransferase/cobyric acid decarboxylase-like protein